MSSEISSIIYYNALVINDTSATQKAVYNAQLGQNLLERAGDYYGSIIRFNIPAASIPIMNFEILDEKTGTGKYGIAMTYNDGKVDIQVANNLIWIDNVVSPTANTPKWVTGYRQMITMINNCLTSLYDLVVLAGYDPGIAPWMEYDPDTQLCSLYVNANYMETATYPVKIYYNIFLYELFQNLGWISNLPNGTPSRANNQDYLLVARNYGNNKVTNKDTPTGGTMASGFVIKQTYNTLYNWNSFKTLQIVSYNMPVINEVTPAESSDGTFSTIPIIQDFQLPSDQGPDARSIIQYSATGQYRWFNMTGDQPLRQLNFSINFTDQYGNVYPLYLQPETSASVKFAFYRKKILNPQVGVFLA